MEPTILCDKNVSARVGDLYVKIKCMVEHPNVDVDHYAFEIGETGEVIYPGNVTDSFDEVSVQVSWQWSSSSSSTSVPACNPSAKPHARSYARIHSRTHTGKRSPTLQALVYDIFPSTTAVFSYVNVVGS